jgi:hypothetical protein
MSMIAPPAANPEPSDAQPTTPATEKGEGDATDDR